MSLKALVILNHFKVFQNISVVQLSDFDKRGLRYELGVISIKKSILGLNKGGKCLDGVIYWEIGS